MGAILIYCTEYVKKVMVGFLVEADSLLTKRLQQKRKRDKVYNVAVGIKNDEKLEFHILSLPTRSSLDKKHIEQEMEKGIKLMKTIQIQYRTINNFM